MSGLATAEAMKAERGVRVRAGKKAAAQSSYLGADVFNEAAQVDAGRLLHLNTGRHHQLDVVPDKHQA